MLVSLPMTQFLLHFRNSIPPIKIIIKKPIKCLYFMKALNIFSVLSPVRPEEVKLLFQKKEHGHLTDIYTHRFV